MFARKPNETRFATASGTADGAVVLEGVAFGYPERGSRHTVLVGIDGRIEPGETIALLGQSGSGKSTLLHLVAGLERPDAGTISVGGVPLDRMSETERTLFRRHRIGLVFQSFNLLPTLTVADNIALAAELGGMDRAKARLRSLALLVDIGLDEHADRFPDRLSGGEQQRVAIARALVNDPCILLADEPTGNLDSKTGDDIVELLETRLRRRGKTMLIATHSVELAARADRIWRLRDGRLVAAE